LGLGLRNRPLALVTTGAVTIRPKAPKAVYGKNLLFIIKTVFKVAD
jgi:hypothetical protein